MCPWGIYISIFQTCFKNINIKKIEQRKFLKCNSLFHVETFLEPTANYLYPGETKAENYWKKIQELNEELQQPTEKDQFYKSRPDHMSFQDD